MEKLLIDIYIILGIYFIIGGIGIVLINHKKGDAGEKQSRWVKYWVYLLLVALVIHVIWFGYFLILSIILSAIGLYEIYKINKRKIDVYYFIPYLIYLIIIYLFISAASLKKDTLFYTYIMILIFDGFSQITGQLIGKRKMFPTISPNKTNEGFFGGMIAIAFTHFIFLGFKTDISTLFGILFVSMFLSLFALAGDILASYFKRLNGVKDYSNLIPEHGGVLDRFDSFIFTTAIVNLIYFIFRQF